MWFLSVLFAFMPDTNKFLSHYGMFSSCGLLLEILYTLFYILLGGTDIQIQ